MDSEWIQSKSEIDSERIPRWFRDTFDQIKLKLKLKWGYNLSLFLALNLVTTAVEWGEADR
mgnify:CR=1 FL=1